MKKLKILIEGMHCASCASNLERSIKKVSGVKEAKISLLTRKGIIEADDSASEEEIKKAISKVGNYKAVAIENA